MTAAAEVMQEAEQRAAALVRRHYHSTYPPSTIVLNRSEELLDTLARLEIPYRETETLVLAEMSDLVEKLPGLQQWLEGEKQAAEQRVQKLKLKNSTRIGGYSNVKNSERVYSGGGVAHNTTMPPSFHYNILEKIISSDRLRALARKRGNPNRVHTSIKVDRDVWLEFKSFVAKRNLTVSEVLEELILIYLDMALAQDAKSGTK